MKKEKSADWFKSWFDTSFYHTLYKNRDFAEAEQFIDKLHSTLKVGPEKNILDLACGRGRHSIYLNKKGLTVTGVDLSEQSIEYAKKYENSSLHFEVHDMREAWDSKFDLIFNLFTSFGYFETIEEDYQVLQSIYNSLNTDGVFILDYINIFYAVNNIQTYEEKTIDNIDFQITKSFEDNKLKKNIKFFSKGEDYNFEEKLNGHTKDELVEYLEKIGFQVDNIYGDYSLNPFNETHSERLILIVIKK